jgi:hypothetical protein
LQLGMQPETSVLAGGCVGSRSKGKSVALLRVLRHFKVVNVSAIPSDATASTLKLVETWITSCNEFRQRERHDITEQVPSPKRLAHYREELKWMIRGARALLNLVSDPDFPEREFVPEISGKLLQLEDSWKSLNNPMTDAAADAILQKAFPHEA